MIKPPCKDCKDRKPGCHSELCPHGWSEWEKEHARQRLEDYKEREAVRRVIKFGRGSSVRRNKE